MILENVNVEFLNLLFFQALILDETEQHINYLEYTLSALFDSRAHRCGKAVLWQLGDKYHQISLQDIKADFEEKQAAVFSQ
ncbi:hypothetical protein SNE40_013153 [Patella caerulea]|uniref:Uncharacterized protein n=1 Tax=Patella caerulea TaxID=87958 RepID=A0AAN8JIT3_PATCE